MTLKEYKQAIKEGKSKQEIGKQMLHDMEAVLFNNKTKKEEHK